MNRRPAAQFSDANLGLLPRLIAIPGMCKAASLPPPCCYRGLRPAHFWVQRYPRCCSQYTPEPLTPCSGRVRS